MECSKYSVFVANFAYLLFIKIQNYLGQIHKKGSKPALRITISVTQFFESK